MSIQYAVLRRSKTLFQEIFSPSLSLSLYYLCDSWPRGHLPYCAFCPSAHSALPKAQCSSSSTKQSCQTPTGGRQVCISAGQLSLQQSGVTVNGNFFHTLPKIASYLCSTADTLKPKIDGMLFFFPAIAIYNQSL